MAKLNECIVGKRCAYVSNLHVYEGIIVSRRLYPVAVRIRLDKPYRLNKDRESYMTVSDFDIKYLTIE